MIYSVIARCLYMIPHYEKYGWSNNTVDPQHRVSLAVSASYPWIVATKTITLVPALP